MDNLGIVLEESSHYKMYTSYIQKAINKAADLHRGQTRKGDGLPYIVHPFSVAWILSNYTNDEDIIAAGLLHDVLEDVEGYEYEDLKRDFGEKIANIVREVSEEGEDLGSKNWEERKQKYLSHLENASFEALMICAADKIHNLISLIEGYNKQGRKVFEKFNAPIEKKMEFYGKVLEILQRKLDNKIVERFASVYKEARDVFIKGN